MTGFSLTGSRLRRSGCSIVAASQTGRFARPPHGFHEKHFPGMRQFTLWGKSMNGSDVLVRCTLPSKKSVPWKPRDVVRHASKSGLTCSSIQFACQVSNLSPNFPFNVHVCCHTLLGQVCVDSAMFTRETISVLEGPENVRTQLYYQGPYLTQGHLAECVVSKPIRSSPMEELKHAHSDFFSPSVFESSPHHFFGHMPVHTVKPELSHQISSLLECFGIDDTLASYVEQRGADIETAEVTRWRNIVCRRMLS